MFRRKRGSFARSVKRAYYQPVSPPAPEPEPKPPKPLPESGRWILRALYTLSTLALLAIAYPVGLALLWVRKFKARFGVKLALSVLGCAAFLWLVAGFVNAPAVHPALVKVQQGMRSTLSYYGADSERVVETYGIRLSEYPENLSNVTFHAIRYLQNALSENIRIIHTRTASVLEQSKDLLYVALIRTSGFAGPAEAPEESPAPAKTPEPTRAAAFKN